jgi:hypothetical protein
MLLMRLKGRRPYGGATDALVIHLVYGNVPVARKGVLFQSTRVVFAKRRIDMQTFDVSCSPEAPESIGKSIVIYLIWSGDEVFEGANGENGKSPEIRLEEMVSEIEEMDSRFRSVIRIVVERTTAGSHLNGLTRNRLISEARAKEVDLVIGCWMKKDLTQEVFSLDHKLWRKVRGHGTRTEFIPPKLDVAGWLKEVKTRIFRFLGAPNPRWHQPTPTLIAT